MMEFLATNFNLPTIIVSIIVFGGNVVLCGGTLGGSVGQAVLQGKGVGQPV